MTKKLFLGLFVSMAFTASVSAEQKLYVLNSHGKEVTVIAKELKKIAVGSAIYWMTGTPDGKTLYVSSADGDFVTVIDTETATITTKIEFPKGSAPKRILVLDVPEA